MVLQRAGHDLRGRGRAAVDQQHDRQALQQVAARRVVALGQGRPRQQMRPRRLPEQQLRQRQFKNSATWRGERDKISTCDALSDACRTRACARFGRQASDNPDGNISAGSAIPLHPARTGDCAKRDTALALTKSAILVPVPEAAKPPSSLPLTWPAAVLVALRLVAIYAGRGHGCFLLGYQSPRTTS